MEVKERKRRQLRELIDYYSSGKNSEFADTIGVSSQVVNNWLSRGSFDIEIIHNSFKDLSPDWLITGEGSMLRQQPTGYEMPRRNEVSEVREFPLKSVERRIDKQMVPIYDIEATASILEQGNISGKVIEYISIPNLSQCDGAVAVRGESMYPIIQQGDLVLYKVYHDLTNIIYGKMYLVQVIIEGDALIMVKYIHKAKDNPSHILLCSENPEHPPMEVALDNVRSVALIKGSIRYHTM